MTDYVLEITLQSPLTSGSGEGRVGLVDKDVAYDDLGIPILPGKRLKGLWREAYHNIVDAWKLCGNASVPTVEDIFGKTGEKPDPKDINMHISNAELKEVSSLTKRWLAYLQHTRKLSIEDVMQHFATVRAQTAIDRLTGSAAENTLRLTRTLRSGRVFHAKVSFVSKPCNEVIKGLARGAAALQYMGTARTRGLGKVRCRLLSCRYTEPDLTKYVLKYDSLPELKDNPKNNTFDELFQTPLKENGDPESGNGDSLHILRYQLTLNEPVVIPTGDGDPNTVVTQLDIPGSHLWGVAAWKYLQQPDCTAKDPDFRSLFLDRGLRFLTAYPEVLDDGLQRRLIPIPHSIRKFKENGNLVDLAERLDKDEKKKPKERLKRGYTRLDTGILKTHAVKTELNYHHAQSEDRSKGRALDNDGAIFKYEAIQAEQTFQGAVLGSKSDLKKLQEWLPDKTSIRIGRSRSAQYGDAKFKWITDSLKELSDIPEWNGFLGTEDHPDLGDHLIITTLSPLLSPNNTGHPMACFPECELAEILGLKLKLSRSYTRTELISGYQTHLRLPRQQWPAIAAGSVFIFDIPQDSGKECLRERLLKLERDGLGLRKGEGYGRVGIKRHGGESQLTGTEEEPLEPSAPDAPNSAPDEEVETLLCGVVRRRCLSEIQQLATNTAGKIARQSGVKIPSNSLLERLRLFLKQDSLIENLDNLRDTAKDNLMKGEINTSDFGMSGLSEKLTLLDLFKEVWNKQKSWTGELIKTHVENICPHETHKDIIETLKNNDSNIMCREYLNCLLTALHRE